MLRKTADGYHIRHFGYICPRYSVILGNWNGTKQTLFNTAEVFSSHFIKRIGQRNGGYGIGNHVYQFNQEESIQFYLEIRV
jgi:hypothetical protein